MNARSFTMLAALLICSAPAIAQQASNTNSSNTVIGANAMLSEGSTALLSGDWQRGLELTRMGLSQALSPEDRAAGLANMCAGHAALRQFDKGLEYCNQSLAISEDNWRAWQNRAACNLGLGRIEESLRDLQRGLALNPHSDALQKTLAIAREYEKQQQERLQNLLES
jgi:tetratricopeptide (TPR) repeat protein